MKKIKLSYTLYKELQEKILKRDGYRCVICNGSSGIQIHHIIKRSKKRLDTPNNLIVLCYKHHNAVETNKIIIKADIKQDNLIGISIYSRVPNANELYLLQSKRHINEPKE